MTYCIAMVFIDSWRSANSWRSAKCSRKAVTAGGYCKQHDPELAAQRAAARAPTKFARKEAARTALDKWMAENMDDRTRIAVGQMIRDAWADWVTPPWPLPDYFAAKETNQ